MTTGIYKLDFKGTNKVYVGQAKSIEKRFLEHLASFKNSEASKKLMEAYRIYGEPTYTVICECVLEDLNSTENEAIEIYDSYTNGFNTFRNEGGSIRGQGGLNHSNSKYSKKQILRVFSLLYRTTIPYSKISEKLGISVYLVNNIASGNHHLWLKETYPEKFATLLANKSLRNAKNLKVLDKEYKLVSPSGEEFWVKNIAEFCRSKSDLSLNVESARSNIAKVLRGTIKAYKGWTTGKRI